ncbi:MAG: GDSL-type esterase/lipase family protein, partial [Bacteroidota bacterium]
GWTSAQILEGLEEWLEAVGPVDVVLFSSPGGNDILNGLESYEETIANINGIIDLLQATHPDITVIIEQTAPAKSDFTTPKLSEDFMRVNAEILRIAEEQNTAETPVIAVDMFTGFDDSHLADDVHYNESGAQLIAARYLEVLQDVLQR